MHVKQLASYIDTADTAIVIAIAIDLATAFTTQNTVIDQNSF